MEIPVKLVVDSKGVKSELNGITRDLTKSTEEIAKNTKNIFDIQKIQFALSMIERSIQGFQQGLDFVKQIFDNASKWKDIGSQLGISPEQAQTIKVIADDLGISSEKITNSMETFINKLNEAKSGSKSVQENFNKLGIDWSSTGSDMMSVISEFQKLSKKNLSSTQSAAGRDLFGKQFTPIQRAYNKENIQSMEQELEDKNSRILSNITVENMDRRSKDISKWSSEIGVGFTKIVDKVMVFRESFNGELSLWEKMFGEGRYYREKGYIAANNKYTNISKIQNPEIDKNIEGLNDLINSILSDYLDNVNKNLTGEFKTGAINQSTLLKNELDKKMSEFKIDFKSYKEVDLNKDVTAQIEAIAKEKMEILSKIFKLPDLFQNQLNQVSLDYSKYKQDEDNKLKEIDNQREDRRKIRAEENYKRLSELYKNQEQDDLSVMKNEEEIGNLRNQRKNLRLSSPTIGPMDDINRIGGIIGRGQGQVKTEDFYRQLTDLQKESNELTKKIVDLEDKNYQLQQSFAEPY